MALFSDEFSGRLEPTSLSGRPIVHVAEGGFAGNVKPRRELRHRPIALVWSSACPMTRERVCSELLGWVEYWR